MWQLARKILVEPESHHTTTPSRDSLRVQFVFLAVRSSHE
jgi:hypothetical protein